MGIVYPRRMGNDTPTRDNTPASTSVGGSGHAWRPSFVILGVERGGDGVTVYASRTLYGAELEWRAEVIERPSTTMWKQFIPGPKSASIRTDMADIVSAHGATFSEALAKLFESWSADGNIERALNPGDA